MLFRSDSILITAGVFGFAQLMVTHVEWIYWVKYIGAVFLFIYGAQHFYQAYVAKVVCKIAKLKKHN